MIEHLTIWRIILFIFNVFLCAIRRANCVYWSVYHIYQINRVAKDFDEKYERFGKRGD